MLKIKNWEKFQHYKDRNPPWIKLHYELLTSRDWIMLDDASRVVAIACMLIASRGNGQIPNDPDFIQRIAYLHKKPNLKPLIDIGFLVMPANASKKKLSASKALASACASYIETETDTDTEKEEDSFEPQSDSKPPTLVFPTVGNTKTWDLNEHSLKPLREAFPSLDILAESKKALAWVLASPERRKTERGMPRFLFRWMERAKPDKKPIDKKVEVIL